MDRTVLCGASAYENKYYLNELFLSLPKAIQEELKILCVLFTEEAGGVLKIVFESDGFISLETEYAENDFAYDDIESGLMIREVQTKHRELFEALENYYQTFFK